MKNYKKYRRFKDFNHWLRNVVFSFYLSCFICFGFSRSLRPPSPLKVAQAKAPLQGNLWSLPAALSTRGVYEHPYFILMNQVNLKVIAQRVKKK